MEGIRNREEAAELTNLEVFVRVDELPLYQKVSTTITSWWIKGCLENGEEIGTVTEIMETGANDVYVVTDKAGKEILLPAIDSVIIRVDLSEKQMVVKPPEWE
jgi:16S rRNA processing protein RimM